MTVWVNAEWDFTSTKSMRSETPCQLSQRGVRLHINIVNAEWDSTSTESMQKAPTFTKISSFRVDSVDVEGHSTLTQLTGVSHRVDSVDVESNLALTQLTGNETVRQLSHHQMLKILNQFANSRTKSKTLKSFIIWPIYAWSVQKTEQ